jgi:hypothetical protein
MLLILLWEHTFVNIIEYYWQQLPTLVREGIPFHLEGLRASGESVPEPSALVETVDVA